MSGLRVSLMTAGLVPDAWCPLNVCSGRVIRVRRWEEISSHGSTLRQPGQRSPDIRHTQGRGEERHHKESQDTFILRGQHIFKIALARFQDCGLWSSFYWCSWLVLHPLGDAILVIPAWPAWCGQWLRQQRGLVTSRPGPADQATSDQWPCSGITTSTPGTPPTRPSPRPCSTRRSPSPYSRGSAEPG